MFNPFDNSYDKLALDTAPFPPGRHVVFISEVGLVTSKTGTPAIEITFDVHDPASPHKGKRLRWMKYWTSPNALPRLASLCRSCYHQISPFKIDDEKAVREALIDQVLAITVKHKKDDYNGKERIKVEADKHDKVTPDEARRLCEEYGDSMLPPLGEDEAAAPGEASGKSPDNDDDIPF